ncbi:MAG: hypothetical protein GEU28_01105 [Dehalococcoidia bacterium]|nr:hypothetical protein [Dehalococcoidia bacterium]
MESPDGGARLSGMSLVLENGDVHHFYAVHDGIHHSYNAELRGHYERALAREMSRPGARVVYQWGAADDEAV